MAKKKSPEQQALEREVKKQRKRIQQFVRRAQKRGYTFSKNVVPNLPKKITEKTLSRYKKITPQTLYEKAVYVSPEGISIEGTKRRVQERYESAAKGAETRERHYIAKLIQKSKQFDRDYEDYNYEWYDNYEGYQTGAAPSGVPAPTERTTLVLDNIIEQIETWEPSPLWSDDLKKLKEKDRNLLGSTLYGVLASEGREAVSRRCQENAIELNAIVDRVLFESGDGYRRRGVDGVNQDIQRFAAIIKGSAITIRESLEFTEFGEHLNYED